MDKNAQKKNPAAPSHRTEVPQSETNAQMQPKLKGKNKWHNKGDRQFFHRNLN
jgi:hypothetical protein